MTEEKQHLVCLVIHNGYFSEAELRCEPVRGCKVSRFEQFETSPETTEQELRPAICEQRQI